MSDFSVSDAGIAGLRLIRRQPMTVAAWGLFIFVAAIVPLALLISVVGGHIWAIVDASRDFGEDSHEVMQAVFRMLAGALLVVPIVILFSLFGRAMMVGAVFRAVIEPKKSSFAYLRLGSQELWILLTLLVGGVLLGVASAAINIPLLILTVAVGGDRHEGWGLLLWGVGHIVSAVVLVWLTLRFSMGAPLSFVERRFALFESWNFTKGHALKLFLMALLVVAIVIVLEIVVGSICFFALAATGLAAGLNEETLRDFFSQPPQAWIGAVGGVALAVGFLIAMIASIFSTVALAPWAAAYVELAKRHTREPGVAGLRLDGGPDPQPEL